MSEREIKSALFLRVNLDYRQAHRVKIELEENARNATAMLEHARVVGDTVLVRMEWIRTWSNVCCWYHI